ncbi:MAG: TonB-dependent receptor [Prolixibacteraceae bacterium]|jgi:TonB-linked SusC/RagA family outer membrane protein|nr:TonB-dependent receptor [Prolixibacteraceae bacterium]
MRLTLFVILISTVQILAGSAYSQNTRFTIVRDNSSIEDILKLIEDQSNYYFLYNGKLIDVSKRVSINVTDLNLEKTLTELLRETNISYQVVNRQVILSPRDNVFAASQQVIVSGKVTDPAGQPLPGVSVIIKGTTSGTITDFGGKYTLPNVPADATLVFSFVGMKSQEVPISGKTSVNITMVEETIGLEEVVAIGYGTQRKVDLTGAVANMKAENLNVESNTNILRALQGKIAGVEIVSRGGDPGNNSSVMIRGVGTFNNNAPLYIVDGMYMDNINFLNPNDIETIDILKDASSAAIYGSRAANGVIIVTTKSGRDTAGTPTITVSANLGFQNTTKKIGVLNAEEWINISTISREAGGKPALDMALAPQADINWQDELMRIGLMQNYNLSAQGGNKNFKYYVGGGYTNQEGIIIKTDYERMNIQVKTEFKKGIVTIGENLLVSYEKTSPVTRTVSRVGGIVGSMLNSIPTYAIYDETKDGGYNGPWGDAITWANPVGIINLQKEQDENYKTYVNTYAMVDLPFGLQYKLNVNTDLRGSYSYSFTPHYNMGLNQSNRNSMSESRGQTKSALIENLLTFNQTFGDHKLTALAGYTFQHSTYRVLGAGGSFMPDGITVIDAATETNGGSSETVTALTSYLGRVFYSYKNKYLLSATIRRDGSSKFLKQNRFGNFPSVSAGWNIREEAFMQNIRFLDMLKLRGGYGVLGNQEVGNYLYSSDVTANINYVIDGTLMWNGAFPKIFASPSIKWENTKMTNLGVDAAFFNNRLKTTMEYYIKNTTDILLNVPIPASTGAGNDPLKNAGHIRNKGFELMVGWDNYLSKEWNYSLNFVASTVNNEVVKMGTGDQVIWSGKPNQSGATTTKSLEGYPIGGFWLIETDGLFLSETEVSAHSKDGNLIQPNAKPGDIRFKDANNDGKINDDDRVYKGSPFPDLSLGMNAMLKWKNFDLTIGLQANFGAKIYNSMRPDLEDISKGTNYSTAALGYWHTGNSAASFPRLIWGDPNQNARTDSDRFLESGDYFRISNLQLGYDVPKTVFPYFGTARIYINADNLYTYTNYSGFTPDVNGGSALERGVDRYTYPLPRTITIGINVSF